MQLIFNDGLGDWREINEAWPKYQAVTAADVKRVVNEYFTKENRSVAIYTRKSSRGPSDDPYLAGLSPEQRAELDQVQARLKEEKDAAKLKAALPSLEERIRQADEKTKSFLQAQKKLVEQRLAELK
jgi:hypothetical protein